MEGLAKLITNIESVRNELQFSAAYLSANKLHHSSKWCSELLLSINPSDLQLAQIQNKTFSDTIEDSNFDCFNKVYVERDNASAPSLQLARTLFDLREYNKYILQILNIHEAIPGHYTQLVYSNQSPSLIKSLFGNNAMIEGWAVYTERMMLENGYGNDEDEMWLMYYKWNLRSTCNTILDYSVHTKNMSKEEAMHLLIDEAFQEKTEAENKWRRVSVTQVQLCCYFTGYTEIYDFREDLKKQMGDKFNLKKFHEKFLSYGSAPVKYIKDLMLADLKSTDK